MSSLDYKLIHEFKLVPALYNRNSPTFKDKAYVDRAWNNIARKLGYDAHILKDRMYQLRNRYNLEKRKMKSLQDEGIASPRAVWPLYNSLDFLNGHIKQRKSYKMVRSISGGPGFRGFTKEEGRYRIARPYFMNQSIEIKEEILDEMYEEHGNRNDTKDTNDIMNASDSQPHTVSKTSQQTLKNINKLKQSLLAAEEDCSNTAAPKKVVKNRHHPSHKFEAFGSFISNSLQDLPPETALTIINRFTSDIVHALTLYRMESSNS
ncbi:hypothetical protein HA402_002090 [Bradysia odoriphaga]|nr:hypothetical protein HA402_002090 [Bradysia odoriphaga]